MAGILPRNQSGNRRSPVHSREHVSWIAAAIVCLPVIAADPVPPSPAVVESFTRSVQPLLLNRCATGGCHAGRNAKAPVFLRGNAAGQIDRDVTLANLESLRKGNHAPERVRDTIARLAGPHPAVRSPSPLEPAKLAMLRDWLLEACKVDACEASDSGRVTTASNTAATPTPNRFREMLQRANDPTPLWPPPQEPKGVILKNDADE